MADSTFYRKKIVVEDLEATEINGIQGNIIDPGVNTIGQVLKITSLDPKSVAFEDNLPDTTPFVNGYVLKILDKDNNTYTWAEDSEGGTVPLILTGDNIQALTVRNTLNEPKFTVDTINSEVEVDDASLVLKESGTATQASIFKTSTETIIATNENISIVATGTSTFNIETGKVILKEYNDVTRFAVRKQTGDTIFNVDTSADIVTSFGETRIEGTDSASKFGVYTNADGINPVLGVDTLNQVVSTDANQVDITATGNILVTSSEDGVVSSRTKRATDALPTDARAYISMQGSLSPGVNGSIDMGSNLAGVDRTIKLTSYGFPAQNVWSSAHETKHQSDVSLVLGDTVTPTVTVNPSTQASITAPTIQITGATTTEFLTTTPVCAIAPTLDTHLTNRLYVENRVGNLYAAIGDSSTVTGANASILDGAFVGTLTVPAGAFQIGDSFHLVMGGMCSFSGGVGETITLEVRRNVTVLGSIVVPTTTTGGSVPWELECDFTIRGPLGASAVLISNFDFTYSVGTQFLGGRSIDSNTINTSASNTLDVHAEFSAGTNSIYTQLAYLKRMH
jgi:hypothetical protein